MRRLTLLFLFNLLIISGFSQSWKYQRYEVWGGVSVFQYYGDIGGSATKNNWLGLKDISLKSNRPGINFGGIYRLNEKVYFYGSNAFGFFAQTDKGSVNSSRNFAFTTIADELTVQVAYFIIAENKNYTYTNIDLRGGFKNIKRILSVYTFTGAGGLFYKVVPKESLIGSPRFDGSNSITLTVPVGLGVKLAYTQNMSIVAEIGARLTLTDKLDGFTSQYSKHNDFYYIMNFKAVYRLSAGKRRFIKR
jgi:hypothetical protein